MVVYIKKLKGLFIAHKFSAGWAVGVVKSGKEEEGVGVVKSGKEVSRG